MAFTLCIDNLRALRRVRWRLDGVNALVGVNGAGKSTILLALQFLRAALDHGPVEAVNLIFGGAYGLRCHDALEGEYVEVGIDLGETHWRVRFYFTGAAESYRVKEFLDIGKRRIYTLDGVGNLEFLGEHRSADGRLGLRAVFDAQWNIPEVEQLVRFLQGIIVSRDVDLYRIRQYGSCAERGTHLRSRGGNVFTMLRLWHRQRSHRHRCEFVLSGLRAAFPKLVGDIDFPKVGNTVVARLYRPGYDVSNPLACEANGMLTLMVSLCALAAADDGGVVALDRVGAALHPRALRVLARRADLLSRQKELVIIMATHSTVLLNYFDGRSDEVFVLHPGRWPGPAALSDWCNPTWLDHFYHFYLRDLYGCGEFVPGNLGG